MKLNRYMMLIAPALLILLTLYLVIGCAPSVQYTGDLKDGLPHGQGTWSHPSGSQYIGEFYEGLRHGQGSWTHPSGISYTGGWQYGKYHGFGTLLLPDGSSYEGEWARGEKHGQGTYRWADGKHYTGSWKHNLKDGFGVLENDAGFSYEGYWKEGRKHGQGSAFYADGSSYHGEWLNDMRHGSGTFTYPDGTIFEGGWEKDLKHGRGIIIRPDGTTETGAWLHGEAERIPVESVSLSPSDITLTTGGATATLVARISPEYATDQTVTWTTSNPTVAEVVNGIVRPRNPGSAVITATTEDGNHTDFSIVTVSFFTVPVTGIRVDRTAITLRVGETATLIATIIPANADDQTVFWMSSDPEIAVVYRETIRHGGVRAISAGVAWITITSQDGQKTTRCEVTVLPVEDLAIRTLMPSLVGRTLDEAEAMIADAGLLVGAVTSEFSAIIPENQVISQNPDAYTSVTRGTLINLVIARSTE
ncbi:MAG TPA: Ig-like domain-containing protein [Candidatus Limnocylindrales bacterium]|nr:Ig-like domain-containing protein [Candidatus Limnocylindrales bacterium]